MAVAAFCVADTVAQLLAVESELRDAVLVGRALQLPVSEAPEDAETEGLPVLLVSAERVALAQALPVCEFNSLRFAVTVRVTRPL